MDVFIEISLIFGLATLIALFMQLLRLPLLLGHIITGILVGPAVLNLLHSEDTIEIFSKLGITALLFIVGLSLSPQVIRDVGRVSLITGIGQILFTTLFGFLIGQLFGFSWLTSLYLAIAFTFSSTIIVLKLLSDRRDLGKLYGKIAIGFLLVQDVAATLILIFVSSASQDLNTSQTLLLTAGRAIGIGAILLFVTLFLLPRLTRLFAASQEFLFIFSIGWGVGLAALFHQMGLSIEIGALAAGVALASSPYHYEISAKMKMLRDFFIIMFFILLGSQLGLDSLADVALPAGVFSLFILIGNPFIVMVLMGILGYTKKTGFYAGLTVAQISEFSFILILLGVQAGHLSEPALSLTTLVGISTITLSSLLILYADPIYRILAPALSIFERPSARRDRNTRSSYDAVLFGCHRVGTDFIATLKNMGMRFLVVDFDPAVIAELQRKKIKARYGDAHDNEFLDELNFEKTKLIISTLPDFETNLLILNKAKKANPDAVVLNIAHTIDQANILYRDGSSYVILPHYLGGNYAAMLLEKIGNQPKKFLRERKKHLAHLSAR